jgi:hypothetical protein
LKVAIHQPNYLPYLGFFHKIYLSDVFVILDTVQFVKSGPLAWMNRNKIRTKEGWTWLSVPVLTKGRFPVAIKQALIDNTGNWRKKHWYSISCNYNKAKYFKRYADFFEQLYSRQWDKLAELNQKIIDYLFQQLGIGVKIVKASELEAEGTGTELLINICKEIGANSYIYGRHGEDYMDAEDFRRQRIRLLPQDFRHPRYQQLHQPFIEGLSVIDLLFNEGENSAKIIQRKAQSLSVKRKTARDSIK